MHSSRITETMEECYGVDDAMQQAEKLIEQGRRLTRLEDLASAYRPRMDTNRGAKAGVSCAGKKTHLD